MKKRRRMMMKMASSRDQEKVRKMPILRVTKIRNKEVSSALCNKLSYRNKHF
jgi:hypothetical protein